MPTPKMMLWIVGLAGATYLALKKVEARQAGGTTSRYGF